jgi:hypothetical protein
MLFGWLLPDASYQELADGWKRNAYRPRHGRPPLAVRGAQSAAAVVGRARERYLGMGDEEGRSAVLLADPPRTRTDMPKPG